MKNKIVLAVALSLFSAGVANATPMCLKSACNLRQTCASGVGTCAWAGYVCGCVTRDIDSAKLRFVEENQGIHIVAKPTADGTAFILEEEGANYTCSPTDNSDQ